MLTEDSLEQTLLGRIAALDPKLAAQNADQMMDKGQFPTTLPEVSGQVLSQAGAPVTDMAVVLFTVDRKYWGSSTVRRVRSLSRVTAEGTFRFTGLLPGEYCLAVLMDLDSADLQDPEFLEQLLPAGIRMTLAEGDRKVQNVKLAGR